MDNIEYIDEISKGGIKKENDDFTMNTKLFERSKIMRFDDKTFFNNILGFEFHWYFSPHHTFSGEKILNKNHLKCNVIAGSIVKGLGEPIYFSFCLR